MAPTFSAVLLVLLGAWSFWTLWGFPYTNGMLAILADLHRPGASIPGPTFAPMKQVYTGLKAVDTQLTRLVAFVYTLVDGSRADVSLAGLDFGGQVAATWVLFTVEGLRWGNRGKWYLTAITVLGLLLQNIGFACIAPFWMALHLLTSPTVTDPSIDDLVVAPLQLTVAPLAIALGYGIPSAAMCLHAPTRLSFAAKQSWIAAQQAWPLWIGLVQLVVTVAVANVRPVVNVMTDDDKKARSLTALQGAYGFALLCATAGHHTTWGLATLAAALPGLFVAPYAPMMQPRHVFAPVRPFGPRQAATLADGALWFLQWDSVAGTAAVLVWALTLHIGATRPPPTVLQGVGSLAAVAGLAVIVGPAGAAVVVLWGRDELVWRRWEAERDRDVVAAVVAPRRPSEKLLN